MSRATTQILIGLTNADPAALTATTSLQRFLGFGDRLRETNRRILWEISGPAGRDPDPVIAALQRSGLLWNPNKEIARMRPAGEGEEILGPPAPGSDGWEFYLAWNPERDLDCAPPAFHQFREQGWHLCRGILWGLWLTEPDPVRRRTLGESALFCRGRKEGLLVHPHLEDCRRIEAGEPVPWLPLTPGGDR